MKNRRKLIRSKIAGAGLIPALEIKIQISTKFRILMTRAISATLGSLRGREPPGLRLNNEH